MSRIYRKKAGKKLQALGEQCSGRVGGGKEDECDRQQQKGRSGNPGRPFSPWQRIRDAISSLTQSKTASLRARSSACDADGVDLAI